MTADIIDGKTYAAKLRANLAVYVRKLKDEHGLQPGLAVVLVGEDPASQVYTRGKVKSAKEVGLASFEYKLPVDTDEKTLLDLINKLNADPKVHGILVQLPLPKQLNPHLVIDAIDPDKDVDGFHIVNVGRLSVGQKGMIPCTPLGCMLLIKDHLGSDLAGKSAVVIGRSNIVGKPMGRLLDNENVTVTAVNSRTVNAPEVCRTADIVVVAIGCPELIKKDRIKPGAVVIDVGINRVPDPSKGEGGTKIVGDVDFADVSPVAGAITPVPGGVGPMTIACLMANTLTAACRANGLPEPEGLIF